MKFKIITLGCKVNQYESEMMKIKLLDNNFIETNDNADIIIVNTCSVTNMADAKSRKIIRSLKRENPNSIMIVCGCSSQNHQEKLNELDIDILIGNTNKSLIVDLINQYLSNHQKIIYFNNNKNIPFEDMCVSKFNHTRAYIKIQDGCNNYCSYCIIPYLRGNIRSKDINKVLEEANTLVNNNHKEIVLTGIHTGSYGKDKSYDLVDLLEELSKIKDLKRIRLSSIEITELNDKFLNFLKTNDKLCNHLHIPLQAGSDHILKLMNRKYDLKYYEDKINKIRSIRKDINISTDVIVGFPQESDEDFESTINFCKKIKFAKIHVFPYSNRDNTLASTMSNQVNDLIKKKRSKELVELSNKLELDYVSNFINKDLEVLVEEVKDNISIGHTSNYIKVEIDKKLKRNEFYLVKINTINKDGVKGILK